MIERKFSPQLADRVFFFFASLVLLLKVGLLFAAHLHIPTFTSDSWLYFNISQNLFSDFYKVSYIRQFEFISDYSTSFPPLFPFLIAVINQVYDIGIYAGYFLNFFMVIVLFVLTSLISKKVTTYFTPAVYIFLILLFTVDFVREVVSARSIPLALVLMSGMILVFLRKNLNLLHILTLGGIAGLLTLNRFDFLLPGLVLGIICVMRTSEKKLHAVAAYYAIFFVMISPWIWYSITYFQSVFISDNHRTVLLATKTFPLDYLPNSKSLPSIWNSPGYWFAYRVLFKGTTSFIAFTQSIWNSVLLPKLVLLNFFFLFVLGVMDKQKKKLRFSPTLSSHLTQYLWLFPVFFIQICLISLTGFLDMRYTVTMVYYLAILFVVMTFLFLDKLLAPKYAVVLMILFVTLPLCIYVIFPMREEVIESGKRERGLSAEYLQPNAQLRSLASVMREQRKEPVAFIHVTENTSVIPAQFASLTGIKTIENPSNLNRYLLVSLLKSYGVSHVYTECPVWIPFLQENFTLESTRVPHLYYIQPKNDGADTIMIPYSIEIDPEFASCSLIK